MAKHAREGQQTTEFVLVIGIAAIVAISMQALARRAMQAGVRHVSDTVLGAPPAPKKPAPGTPPSQQELQAESGRTITEQGSQGFRRVTTTTETVKGRSVNEETRFRLIPDPNR